MRPRFALVGLVYLAIANAAFAVGYGWQNLPDGGIEYLFRIEPGLLETFPGATSEIPRGMPEIRRVRVIVSADKVPNEGTLPEPTKERDQSSNVEPMPPTKTNNDPIIKLPPPPTETMPTSYTDSPPASPIDKPPTGIETPKGTDHESERKTTPPERTLLDKTEPPQFDGDGPHTGNKVEVPESRPWLPLTGALVALFASLGANAYLAWIHQTLRTNYRAMIERMTGESAAA